MINKKYLLPGGQPGVGDRDEVPGAARRHYPGYRGARGRGRGVDAEAGHQQQGHRRHRHRLQEAAEGQGGGEGGGAGEAAAVFWVRFLRFSN